MRNVSVCISLEYFGNFLNSFMVPNLVKAILFEPCDILATYNWMFISEYDFLIRYFVYEITVKNFRV